MGALNNLALTEIRLDQFASALRHFRDIVELGTPPPEVIHNISRLLMVSEQGIIPLPPATKGSFEEVLQQALEQGPGAPLQLEVGWVYMLPTREDLIGVVIPERPQHSTRPPDQFANLTAVGSGTGFVVFPGYILTNRHVLDSGDAFLVKREGLPQAFPAKKIALHSNPLVDLGLLHCTELKAEPLPLAFGPLASRGTEIAVFGYPETDTLGIKLKLTQGVISGVPTDLEVDEDLRGLYMLDAISNPGNSGGPICDRSGSVVAVLTASTRHLDFNMTLGTPIQLAQSLLKEAIPGFAPLIPKDQRLEWPDVDRQVSPSVVLITVYSQRVPVTWSGLRKPPSLFGLPDPWCSRCNGLGTVDCPNRRCSNGSVPTTRIRLVPRADGQGYAPFREPATAPCDVCGARGRFPCPLCRGTKLENPQEGKDYPPQGW